MTGWVVADLPAEAPLERLSIGDSRLGLDAGAPGRGISTGDLRVPRPQVALDAEEPPQFATSGSSGGVPGDARGAPIAPDPGSGRRPGTLGSRDRDLRQHTTRRPRRSTRAPTHRSRNARAVDVMLPQAAATSRRLEAGAHARHTVLLPKAAEGVPRASAPSIRWSLARWHRWHHPIQGFTRDLLARQCALTGARSASRTNGRTRPRIRPESTRFTACWSW